MVKIVTFPKEQRGRGVYAENELSEFTVYRACAPHYNLYEDDILLDTFGIPEDQIDNGDIEDPGISWTLNPVWCRQYAISKHRIVKAKRIKKEDVFAYVSRRGEEEIILL